MFAPSYAGVRGNERAHRLASLVTISEDQPLDHDDVINNLGNIRRVEDFRGSESILSLLDLEVKIGIARNECYS